MVYRYSSGQRFLHSPTRGWGSTRGGTSGRLSNNFFSFLTYMDLPGGKRSRSTWTVPQYFRGATGGYCGKGGMITFHKLMSLGSQQPKRYSTACNARNFSTYLHLAGAAISPGQISKSLHRAGVATSAMQISKSSNHAVAGSFPRQLAHFAMKLTKAFNLL